MLDGDEMGNHVNNQASVAQWRCLHDNDYFERHRHYRGWPILENLTDEYITKYVRLRPDDDVLEIGCGYGRLMYAVADHVRTIIGVDVHEAPLKRARTILKMKTNAQVVLTDGLSLPFDNGSFGVIYSSSVMQHITRSLVRVYIIEARRVLKIGGRLCMQFPDARTLPKRPVDINVNRIAEQSTAWTPDELLSIASDVALKIDIHASPPHSLYLLGVAI